MHKYRFIKAFTLIELMVVIAIIGILAAIVFAPLQTALRKGRDAKKISEMKTLQTALMLYADSHKGVYPRCIEDLEKNYYAVPKNFTSGGCRRNKGPSFIPNKYNYTAYIDENDKIAGYHLYVHLETASQALAGAAKCQGISSEYSNESCFITTNTNFYGIKEPPQGTDINKSADFLEHKNDNDRDCAANTAFCTYDIRG